MAPDQCSARGYAQLAMELIEASRDRVGRDAEAPGNGEFGRVVENAVEDLQFAAGEVEQAGDLSPSLLGEHG